MNRSTLTDLITKLNSLLRIDNAKVMGGSALSTYLGLDLGSKDIDIYVNLPADFVELRLLRHNMEYLKPEFEAGLYSRKGSKYPRFLNNIDDVLSVKYGDNQVDIVCLTGYEDDGFPNFDLNICKVAYDGTNFIVSPQALADINNQTLTYNLTHLLKHQKSRMQARLEKYQRRFPDYTVVIIGEENVKESN